MHKKGINQKDKERAWKIFVTAMAKQQNVPQPYRTIDEVAKDISIHHTNILMDITQNYIIVKSIDPHNDTVLNIITNTYQVQTIKLPE